jgi:hypothetical protein
VLPKRHLTTMHTFLIALHGELCHTIPRPRWIQRTIRRIDPPRCYGKWQWIHQPRSQGQPLF